MGKRNRNLGIQLRGTVNIRDSVNLCGGCRAGPADGQSEANQELPEQLQKLLLLVGKVVGGSCRWRQGLWPDPVLLPWPAQVSACALALPGGFREMTQPRHLIASPAFGSARCTLRLLNAHRDEVRGGGIEPRRSPNHKTPYWWPLAYAQEEVGQPLGAEPATATGPCAGAKGAQVFVRRTRTAHFGTMCWRQRTAQVPVWSCGGVNAQ